ncbi:hypothetical protein V6N13_036792 [Hibiscus sabdariffa]
MAHSINKPPYFNGEHYAYWKNMMIFFIKAKDFHLWDIVEDGPFVPTTSTNDVKETKIGLLNLEYDNFKMDTNEDIKSMFDRFSTIFNQLKGFGEEIPEDKLIRKLIYSLPQSWDSKKTAIIEAKDLKKLKLDELIGSLLTH